MGNTFCVLWQAGGGDAVEESSVMDERLRFVARLLDGEPMSPLCREFGIWRKTGYKVFDRYKDHGLEALTDRSWRPVRYANQLPRPRDYDSPALPLSYAATGLRPSMQGRREGESSTLK